MEWDSPWRPGAPGRHLECSVMAIEHLGRHFDIHTGGVDHIPVHHTEFSWEALDSARTGLRRLLERYASARAAPPADPTDLDLKRADVEVSEADVDALMAERTTARIARDFATSDELRNRLARLGVAVEDHPDGTSSWRWA